MMQRGVKVCGAMCGVRAHVHAHRRAPCAQVARWERNLSLVMHGRRAEPSPHPPPRPPSTHAPRAPPEHARPPAAVATAAVAPLPPPAPLTADRRSRHRGGSARLLDELSRLLTAWPPPPPPTDDEALWTFVLQGLRAGGEAAAALLPAALERSALAPRARGSSPGWSDVRTVLCAARCWAAEGSESATVAAAVRREWFDALLRRVAHVAAQVCAPPLDVRAFGDRTGAVTHGLDSRAIV